MNADARMDYYRLLNIRRDATQEDIQRAYRSLARLCHPDRNQANVASEISRQMSLLNEAYTCLGDISKRRAYDRSLKIKEPVPMRNAILEAALQLLLNSKWHSIELESGGRIFELGARRVGVRLFPVLDRPALEQWIRWTDQLAVRKLAEWSVVMACRVLAIEEIVARSSRHRRQATAIDLIDSRVLGNEFPDMEYRELFQPFFMESRTCRQRF